MNFIKWCQKKWFLPSPSSCNYRQEMIFSFNLIVYAFISSRDLVSASNEQENVYEYGCLQRIHKKQKKLQHDDSAHQRNGDKKDAKIEFLPRVCNSDDKLREASDEKGCRALTFGNYFEVKIATGDWDECEFLLFPFLKCDSFVKFILNHFSQP